MLRFRPSRRVLIVGVTGLVLLALGPLLAHAWVVRGAAARIFTDAGGLQAESHVSAPSPGTGVDVALVLGCTRILVDGRPNAFYANRIAAAVELWQAGAVRGILVSGDNGRDGYDEPTAMRDDLIAAGVPAEFVTCDFAGFRTLDSLARAREVFGLERVVVVSQAVHLPRALYLARSVGLEAWGFAAEAVGGRGGRRLARREWAARVLAFLDVEVLGRGPRFLGPREEIALRPAPR